MQNHQNQDKSQIKWDSPCNKSTRQIELGVPLNSNPQINWGLITAMIF